MTDIGTINKKIDSSNFLIFDCDGIIADSVNVKTLWREGGYSSCITPLE